MEETDSPIRGLCCAVVGEEEGAGGLGRGSLNESWRILGASQERGAVGSSRQRTTLRRAGTPWSLDLLESAPSGTKGRAGCRVDSGLGRCP